MVVRSRTLYKEGIAVKQGGVADTLKRAGYAKRWWRFEVSARSASAQGALGEWRA